MIRCLRKNCLKGAQQQDTVETTEVVCFGDKVFTLFIDGLLSKEGVDVKS